MGKYQQKTTVCQTTKLPLKLKHKEPNFKPSPSQTVRPLFAYFLSSRPILLPSCFDCFSNPRLAGFFLFCNSLPFQPLLSYSSSFLKFLKLITLSSFSFYCLFSSELCVSSSQIVFRQSFIK